MTAASRATSMSGMRAGCLDQGAHFLSPFGTTGEALSVGLAERKAALGWLVEAGIAPERLMPGRG